LKPWNDLQQRRLSILRLRVITISTPARLDGRTTNPVRLVVLDIWMQQMTGMEVLAHLCARWPGTRVIFITGHEDRAAEATVMQAGASGFSIKPLDNEKFIAAVQDALEQA
jgi:two-component system repressor protein LuxO